jgi:hypothetical protein
MMKMIMRHLKRKHDATSIQLIWAEPFGVSRWIVSVTPFRVCPEYELSRSPSKWVALFKALSAKVRL